ncbi:polysaccharide biosynthesis protein [Sporosarcina sp. FA9]|uniref:polysaccharide biosynthesis protein n=1 Tax=Sporosarcina sp. FA9 TaxID=3413030 RepID=UPI003F65B8D1
MSMKKRMSLLIIVDSIIVLSAIYIGYFILYPYTNIFTNKMLLVSTVTIQMAHHFFAWKYGLYMKAWSYASIGELKLIFKAVTYSIIVVLIVQFLITFDIYLRVLTLTWMLHILLIGGSRLTWRLFSDRININVTASTRTMVVGAGSAGRMIVREVLQDPESGMKPILFVDDDLTKNGLQIHGIKVIRGTKFIPKLVIEHNIDTIVIAITSLSKVEMANLSQLCIGTGVKTQVIPCIEDLMTGKVSVNDMRGVKIEDLLGREEVELDMKSIANKLTGKVILVTGAGGSIGSEICRQVIEFRPKELILLGHGENSIYNINLELRKYTQLSTKIIPIVADVKDRNRILDIISEYMPDVIYHAAAHKHVPLMEENPMEAVKNNIFGTKNVAEAADTFGVPYFVLISTDKAVNPPNIMGATKRFAEMIVQNLAIDSNTKYAAVRFGNVLGSRGSVIPLFTSQIKQGGPITVTDPKMTRYFMTIPEASKLVIQAGVLATKGEVFVLDMGDPVRIIDLAKNLIKLSGYDEDDIEIEFSGIRPGEKLFEELLNQDEIQNDYIFPKIYIGRATPIGKKEMNLILEELLNMTDEEVKEVLIGVANRKFSGEMIKETIA